MMVCNTCGAVFAIDDLKVTCQGLACPYCESVSYRGMDPPKKVYPDVKYEEGQGHD